ncbi:MAG: hypothetical protein ACLGH0_02990 [Thermoanaerobaculia bacterium]
MQLLPHRIELLGGSRLFAFCSHAGGDALAFKLSQNALPLGVCIDHSLKASNQTVTLSDAPAPEHDKRDDDTYGDCRNDNG